MANDINFKINKNFGILSTSQKGWTKEVNVVTWNEGSPKVDIRDWSPDHTKMGKGITLTNEEAVALLKVLSENCKSKKASGKSAASAAVKAPADKDTGK